MNKKIFSNSIWMMSEKIVSIFGLIFVTSYVAKYVGPSVFGQISFSMSLFQILQVVAQLGSAIIIFKRISKNKRSGIILINTTVLMRVFFYFLFSFPIVVYYFYHGVDDSFWFILAAFFSCFFSSLDVYSVYYDAVLKSKVNTIVNVFGLIISLVLRWIIAELKMDPVYLAIPIVLTSMFPYLLRLFSYKKNLNILPVLKRHRNKYRKYLLKVGGSFVISDLSIAVYTRLSLLMLAALESKSSVGIYSVALNLSGSWAFITMSFITSTLPSIFSEKDNAVAINKTVKLNLYMFSICIPVIIFAYILGEWFLMYFYGGDYKSAFYPLIILCISTMVSTLGTVSARFIARYSGYSFLSKKMLIVLISSLILNYFMILNFGIIGAAFAALTTELLSLTVFNYFFKKGVVARLHYKTLTHSFTFMNK